MPNTEKIVLLTGFPASPVASRLLTQLHSQSSGWRFRCIVPVGRMDEARDALHRRLGDAAPSRVQLLEGGESNMDFGLSGSEYMRLAGEVQMVHACAVEAHPNMELSAGERERTLAARELREFSLIARAVDHIVYWSPALVKPGRSGRLDEVDYDALSGFHAERIVRRLQEQAAVTVLRPSQVVGDLGSLQSDRLEGAYLLISLLLNSPADVRVPIPGREDAHLHMVPLDYVVDAGIAIAAGTASAGGIYHLVDPTPPTLRQVCERIAKSLGRPAPRNYLAGPAQLMSSLLRVPGLERFTHQPRTLLEQLANDVAYDDRQARTILDAKAIHCRPFDQYVDKMIDTVRRNSRNNVSKRPPAQQNA